MTNHSDRIFHLVLSHNITTVAHFGADSGKLSEMTVGIEANWSRVSVVVAEPTFIGESRYIHTRAKINLVYTKKVLGTSRCS